MLIVIDMQEKLVPHIDDGIWLAERVSVLVRAADLLDVPIVFTEQNPRGLGSAIHGFIGARHRLIEKETFDATLTPAFLDALPPEPSTVWIAGAEAHICVLLTALGLMKMGHRVEWIADAVGSRRVEDRARALERARQDGARVSTVETAVFGWMGSFRHPRFRDVLSLIK
jgi:nicotinamidase-related amidase